MVDPMERGRTKLGLKSLIKDEGDDPTTGAHPLVDPALRAALMEPTDPFATPSAAFGAYRLLVVDPARGGGGVVEAVRSTGATVTVASTPAAASDALRVSSLHGALVVASGDDPWVVDWLKEAAALPGGTRLVVWAPGASGAWRAALEDAGAHAVVEDGTLPWCLLVPVMAADPNSLPHAADSRMMVLEALESLQRAQDAVKGIQERHRMELAQAGERQGAAQAKDVDKVRAELKALKDVSNRQARELRDLQAKARTQEAATKKAEADAATVGAQLAAAEKQAREALGRLGKLAGELEDSQALLEETKAKAAAVPKGPDPARVAELESQLVAASAALKKSQAAQETLQARIKALEAEHAVIQDSVRTADAMLDITRNNMDEERAARLSAEERADQAERDAGEAKTAAQDAQAQMHALREELEAAQANAADAATLEKAKEAASWMEDLEPAVAGVLDFAQSVVESGVQVPQLAANVEKLRRLLVVLKTLR